MIKFDETVKGCPHNKMKPCVQGKCQLWVTYINEEKKVFQMCSDVLRTLLVKQQIDESISIIATVDKFKNLVHEVITEARTRVTLPTKEAADKGRIEDGSNSSDRQLVENYQQAEKT